MIYFWSNFNPQPSFQKSSHNDLVEMITEKAGGVNLLLVGALEHAMFLKKQVNVGGWMAQLRHLHCPAVNPYTTGC